MESVPVPSKNDLYRQLALISLFRAQGFDEDQVAENAKYRGAGHMRQVLEQWSLPTWFVEGDSPPAPKAKKNSGRERKTRSLGPTKELPSADNAAPLFRERLEALIRETEWLKYRKEKLQGRHFIVSSVREAPVHFSDEALSEYRRELGLDEVAESFMHFGGATFNLEGGTLAPPPPLPELIAAYLLAGGQLEPLVKALHPDPESAEWDKIRKHLEGRKSDKVHNTDGLIASAQQLATLIRGSTLPGSRPQSGLIPLEVNLAARISDAKRLNPKASNREIYEDLLHRTGLSEEQLSWGEFRRLANLEQEWPHT
jgi:hypothetical protein